MRSFAHLRAGLEAVDARARTRCKPSQLASGAKRVAAAHGFRIRRHGPWELSADCTVRQSQVRFLRCYTDCGHPLVFPGSLWPCLTCPRGPAILRPTSWPLNSRSSAQLAFCSSAITSGNSTHVIFGFSYSGRPYKAEVHSKAVGSRRLPQSHMDQLEALNLVIRAIDARQCISSVSCSATLVKIAQVVTS